MFKMEGKFLTNIQNRKVMDDSGNKDKENQNIHMWKRQNGLNQQWDIVYSDQWKGEPTKGQLNKRFGMYVQRPFYIVSRMRGGRNLDLIGRNFVIKTRNGRNSQEWWFDQKSLTIKSKAFNQSWDIKSAGKTADMQVWSTSSGWW
jgi:hypothetical protein